MDPWDLVSTPAQSQQPQGKTFDPAAGISIRLHGQATPPQSDADQSMSWDAVSGPAPQEPSTVTKLTTDFLNQGSAAGQRTTPVISAQAPNLVSDQVYQNDAGEMQYKDPATGQLVTTDQNKQVILRDPADNKLKVYARTDNTNEGALSSLGRLIGTGMGSSAPETTAVSVAAKPSEAAPSIADLKASYKTIKNSPEVQDATVPIQEVTDFANGAHQGLVAEGFRPTTASAPGTFAELDRLTPQSPPEPSFWERVQMEMNRENPPPAPTVTDASMNDLLAARRAFQQTAKQVNPIIGGSTPDAAASKDVLGKLDSLIETHAPAMKTANEDYAAAKRAELIDKKMVRAELRAAGANSGHNVANKIRQRMADILINERERRGYSQSELAQMDRIVRGTFAQNRLRDAGKLLGGGGGAHAFYAGILTGGVAPATGFVLNHLANVLTLRQVSQLSEAVRMRSSLGRAIENAATDWQKAHDALVKAPSASKFSAFAIASRNLSNNLASLGVNVAPVQIMRSVQGPTDAKAQGEKQ